MISVISVKWYKINIAEIEQQFSLTVVYRMVKVFFIKKDQLVCENQSCNAFIFDAYRTFTLAQ